MLEAKGQGGRTPLQILADQLTLSQPEGADYAHPLQWHPRIFRPSYGPVKPVLILAAVS